MIEQSTVPILRDGDVCADCGYDKCSDAMCISRLQILVAELCRKIEGLEQWVEEHEDAEAKP